MGNINGHTALGGVVMMGGNGIAVDGSGNVYITGYFSSSAVDFNPGAGTANLSSAGDRDIFFAKYNSGGAYQWAHSIGGSGYDIGNGIAVDGSGNVYITGAIKSADVDFDPADLGAGAFFAKYDTDGVYQWAYSVVCSIDPYEGGGFAIAVDGSDNVYVTGSFKGSDVDFDPGAGTANLSSEDTFIGAIFIAKYDTSGVYQWAHCVGGFEMMMGDAGKGIAADGSGNVYITGEFHGSDIDFDPGAGTVNLSSGDDMGMTGAIFISKYDTSGVFQWAHSVAGLGVGYGIASGGSDIFITGGFTGSDRDFEPGSGEKLLSSNGSRDLFFGKNLHALDFGDLPTAYNLTLLAGDDGARHTVGSLYLGTAIDKDDDGRESANADGDDTNGTTPDEDGITVPAGNWAEGVSGGSVQVLVTGGSGYLSTWTDWDGNDNFTDTGDQIFDMLALDAGTHTLQFDIPAGALSGANTRFARFRLDDENSVTMTPTGLVSNGEVEDYELAFTTATKVSSMSATTENGAYGIGDTIDITVTFSDTVSVTGTPQLTLETGATDRTADYESGDGTDTLTFRYTVESGDVSADLDCTGTDALSLNGGSIRNGGFDADLTLPAPGAAGSLGDAKNLVVDSVAPAAPSAPDLDADSDTGSSDTDNITGNTTPAFSGTGAEADSTVTVISDKDGDLGTATADGSGDWTFTSGSAISADWTFTSGSAISADTHSITVTSTDAVGNTGSESDALSVTIDDTAPTVTMGQADGQSDPTADSPINFSVVFSEAVSDFADEDVDTSASTAAGPFSVLITETESMDGTTYNVAISGMSGAGDIIATVNLNAAQDAAGNNSSASTGENNTVAYDPTLNDISYDLSVSHDIVAEGDAGSTAVTFTVTRSGATSDASTVDFNIAGTAAFGTDYSNIGGTSDASGVSGTISFANGELSKTITTDVLGDAGDEPDETIEITLSDGTAPGSATYTNNPTATTITDDDISLIINETDYDQGGTDTTEFIEIMNISDSAVTLEGHTLELLENDGGTPRVYETITLDSVSLEAGDYFVICDTAADLFNCDQETVLSDSFIGDGSPGAVALKNGTFTVDTVSYDGDFADHTETAGAPADDGTKPLVGLSRHPDGTDTGNNSADFSLRCVTPGASNNIDDSSDCFQLSVDDPGAVTEGDSDTTTITFTVSLSHAAASDITVDYATQNGTATAGEDYDAVTATELTIESGTTSQTFEITVTDDQTDEDDETLSVILSNASANATIADSEGVGTVTDDDTRGITVSDISGPTTEFGDTARFTVVLESRPTADVSIGLTSSDTDGGTVSPDSLTFTPDNWDTAQTVTVTGIDDSEGDGSADYTIVTASATGGDYDGTNPDDVPVTNNDNDTPGITVTPTSLTVSEPDGTAEFTVRLNTQPAGNVTVPLSASADCTISADSVTMTDGNAGESVTVTAADDTVSNAEDRICTVTTGDPTSDDTDYEALDADDVADVTVTVKDDDIAGATVSPTSLSVSEPSGSATFSVSLTTEPAEDVTIVLNTSSDECSATAAGPLTAENYVAGVDITVTAGDDAIADGDQTCTVETTLTGDAAYNGVTPDAVTVTVRDDDTAGVTVNGTPHATEGGDPGTYTIALDTMPTDGSVTIRMTSGEQCNVSPASVTLGDTTPVTVTVTAADDAETEGDHTCTVAHAVMAGPAEYPAGMSVAGVTLSITDNDFNSPPVAENGTLEVSAGGTAAGTLAASDADADDTLFFSIARQPEKGRVSVTNTATGAYIYTADGDAEETDTFTFRADDGEASATAAVTVSISSPDEYYEVTATAVPAAGGSVIPAEDTVAGGDDVTFTVTVTDGWDVATVTDNGTPVILNADDTYTLTGVAEAHDIIVIFDPRDIYRSADTDFDYRVGLSELLRVIQLYSRTDYHCDAAGEDGYGLGEGDQSCTPHSADYRPQDWKISLSELLRVVQFYNVGAYHSDAAGEDGFAPGPGNM